MKRYVIDSVRDVSNLFADLHARIKKPILPEDDLTELVDANGIAVFSKAEAFYFDDLILDCFVFCNDHHLDLHAIVEPVQHDCHFHQTREEKPKSEKANFKFDERAQSFWCAPVRSACRGL